MSDSDSGSSSKDPQQEVNAFSKLKEIDDTLKIDLTEPPTDKTPPNLDRTKVEHIDTSKDNWPEWLLAADISDDAVVELWDGVVHWISGTFNLGTWVDGVWHSGDWKNGLWAAGDFMSGNWYSGAFCQGRFFNGTWHDGIFCQGLHFAGDFLGGAFCEGVWLGGTFKEGRFSGGTWIGGRREGGTWDNEENEPAFEAPKQFKDMRAFTGDPAAAEAMVNLDN